MDTLGMEKSSILLLQIDQFETAFFNSCKREKVVANLICTTEWLKNLFVGSFKEKDSTRFSYQENYHMMWTLKTSPTFKVMFSVTLSEQTLLAVTNSLTITSDNLCKEVGSYKGDNPVEIVLTKDLILTCEDFTITTRGIKMKTMANKHGFLTFDTSAQVADWTLNIAPTSFLSSLVTAPQVTSHYDTPHHTANLMNNSAHTPLMRFNPLIPPPRNRFLGDNGAASGGPTNMATGKRMFTPSKRKIIPDHELSSSSSHISLNDKAKTTKQPGGRTSTPRKKQQKPLEHEYDSISDSPEPSKSPRQRITPQDAQNFAEEFRRAVNIDPEDPLSKFLGESVEKVLLHIEDQKSANLSSSEQERRDAAHTEEMQNLYDFTKNEILRLKQPASSQSATNNPFLNQDSPTEAIESQASNRLSLTLNNSAPIIQNLSDRDVENEDEIEKSGIMTRSKTNQNQK